MPLLHCILIHHRIRVNVANLSQAFVERNKSLKWCPHPGCGRAVRFPEADHRYDTLYVGEEPSNLRYGNPE